MENNMADKKAVALLLVEEMFNDSRNEDNTGEEDINNLLPLVALSVFREDRVKIMDYVENIIPRYNITDFSRFFRITPTTFEDILQYLGNCPEVQLGNSPGGRPPLSLEKQLLIVLWYLVTQDTVHRIADRFGVTDFSVLRSRNKIYHAVLNNLMAKVITWPSDDIDEIVETFNRPANGFPDMIGALDGTHIKIKAPRQNPETYVNRKNYHSVILQGVCREDLRFIDVFCGWPGSVHDARVLRNSDLWNNGLQRCGERHIVADSAYPIRRWLLTPYRDNGHLTPTERHFNYRLSSRRQVIERAFGLLKARFNRLRFVDITTMKRVVETVIVSCIFHNICILSHDENNQYLMINDEIQPLPAAQIIARMENDAEGMLKRDILARQLYQNHLH